MVKALIKKWFTGLTIPQEYVCVDVRSFHNPLSIILREANFSDDVTRSHLFLGYKPLIIGLLHKSSLIKPVNLVKLQIQMKERQMGHLELKMEAMKIIGSQHLLIYSGSYGSHQFISHYHQKINRIREKFRRRSVDNIALPGNLHDQVRLAYSIPRTIAVITIYDGQKINLFPTDLHGPIGDEYYASSLRINGKANTQVERHRKLVISEVSIHSFKDVYALGKNHMKDLQEINSTSIHQQRSATFNYPLPQGVQRYMEVEQFDSLDIGIHRIHFYKIISKMKMEDLSTLGHIHQYYAQWRLDNRLPTQMFFR